jgi:hypothetical protein
MSFEMFFLFSFQAALLISFDIALSREELEGAVLEPLPAGIGLLRARIATLTLP